MNAGKWQTITIDLRMLNSSGIGTYLRNLLPELISAFPAAIFNLLGDRNDMKRFDWAGMPNVSQIDCRSPVYSLSEQVELPAKTPSCDIFWSPHYNVPLFPVRAKKRIVTIHDVFHLAFFRQLTAAQKIYARLVIASAARLSDRTITVSEFSKSEIIKYTGVDGSSISVIHNGINTDRFKKLDNNDIIHARVKYRLPEKFILFVGNVKPHKNLRRLLAAYNILTRQGFSEYQLVIAGKKDGFITGDTGIFSMLEDNPGLKEKVLFTGYIENDDLPALYNAASLFVFPSLYEGFGLSPLEAMACGCPAIVSKAASLPEVCGDAAYYIDPHSADSIADGINRLLTDNDLRQDHITRGLERAGMYNLKSSARGHAKVFAEVLGG